MTDAVATQVAESKSAPNEQASAGSRAHATGILFVLLCAAITRLGYHLLMYPCWTFDTPGYLRAAYLLSHGYFTDGARTPGYPLLLTLARWLGHVPYFDTEPAIIASGLQSILGVASAGLIYCTLLALGVRKAMAIAGAAFFSVLGAVCVWELLLLSQSLSLFTVTLSVALFAVTMAAAQKRRRLILPAISTGVAFSLAVLVRPENLVLCIVLTMVPAALCSISWWRGDRTASRQFGRVALLLPLAAAPMILCWMTWNYVGVGRFRITTLTSWNMSSAVYNLFDRVGPEDRVIGELLAKADLIRNHPEKVPASERFFMATAPGQVVQDTYWATMGAIRSRYREMPLAPPPASGRFGSWIRSFASEDARRFTRSFTAASIITEIPGLDPNDLGDYVGRVSWKLAKAYPGAWLGNAYRNFTREAFRFHMVPPAPGVLLEPRSYEADGEAIRHPVLRPAATWMDAVQAPVLTFLFVLTLALGACFPAAIFERTGDALVADATATGVALAVVGTFVACCLFACYMPHYGVPHWGAIVICGTYGLDRAWRALANRA
jgi:hypothetical protein